MSFTRRIQEVLGWHLQVVFEAGVKSMLANLDDWFAGPVWAPATSVVPERDWFAYLSRPVH